MEKPDYEAIIDHLTFDTPLPSNSLEEKIVVAFKTYRQEHPKSVDGCFILTDQLDEGAKAELDPALLKKYWNRMILAQYGNAWGVTKENASAPRKQTPVPVVPLPKRPNINDAFHRRALSEIHRLGNAAEDIMGSAYIKDLKEGKI